MRERRSMASTDGASAINWKQSTVIIKSAAQRIFFTGRPLKSDYSEEGEEATSQDYRPLEPYMQNIYCNIVGSL